MTEETRACLMAYSWPGNIRELKNVVVYATAMADGGVVTRSCLPAKVTAPDLICELQVNTLRGKVEQTEKSLLLEQYKQAGGNISELARVLKVDRSSLYRKLRRYSIFET